MKLTDKEKEKFFINPPRNGVLKKYFDDLITAKKNIPINYDFDIDKLFKNNQNLLSFAREYQKYESDFDKHARASIPYSYEELIRLYSTIFLYLTKYKTKGNIIEIDSANSSLARALTNISNNRIKTLGTTPNRANIEIFNKNHPKNSYMFEGESKDVVTFLMQNQKMYEIFKDGFDIFLELVGFQMYGKERKTPIKYFKQLLKKDGIALFFEKNSNNNLEEFKKREIQKNIDFKTKFFSKSDIGEKTSKIVSVMDKNLVTTEELIESISYNFKYIIHIWNSGNFNIFIASDNKNNILKMLEYMPKILINKKYLYVDKLPLEKYPL